MFGKFQRNPYLCRIPCKEILYFFVFSTAGDLLAVVFLCTFWGKHYVHFGAKLCTFWCKIDKNNPYIGVVRLLKINDLNFEKQNLKIVMYLLVQTYVLFGANLMYILGQNYQNGNQIQLTIEGVCVVVEVGNHYRPPIFNIYFCATLKNNLYICN